VVDAARLPPSDDVADTLGKTLRLFERTIGISEGLAMAFDPEVVG
jgi:hypothetical protein